MAEVTARNATEELNNYRRGMQDQAGVEAAAREASKSPMAFLEDESRRLKLLLGGTEAESVDALTKRLQAGGLEQGQTALAAMQALNQKLQAAEKQANDRQQSIDALNNEIASLKSLQQTIQQIASTQDTNSKAERDRIDKAVQDLQAKLDSTIQALTERVNKQAENDLIVTLEAIDEKQKTSEELQRTNLQLADLKKAFPSTTPVVPDPLGESDGSIISVASDYKHVFINLGRRNHMVLGMPFEIFDKNRGVELVVDAAGGVSQRGKATVEVVSIAETSATCRIVRSSLGQPIRDGDLISNLVYDKDRTFKFFVEGNFNLDGVGQPSLADLEMVQHLIRQWGGVVTDKEIRAREIGTENVENLLPYNTDFVVLGAETPMPPIDEDNRDVMLLRDKIQKEHDIRKSLVAQAGVLGIPVINQNQFLALIGYYQR